MASREGEFFRINVQVRRERDNAPLYIKSDGERFKDNRTVKVSTGHSYKVNFSLKPSFSRVTGVSWGGIDLSMESGKVDDSSATYELKWSTNGIEPSKSSTRSQLPIVIHFENGCRALFSIQCKYYKPADETHYRWGDELKSIEVECKATGLAGDSVTVLKTTFR